MVITTAVIWKERSGSRYKEADAVIDAIGIFDRHFAGNGASWP
jgi:hypothetical protein